MRFLTLFAAAFLAAITSTHAFAKELGPAAVDAAVEACDSTRNEQDYQSCLDSVEDSCKSFRGATVRECQAIVGQARAEYDADKARAALGVARAAAPTGSGTGAQAAAALVPAAFELPTRRPRELVATTTPPPGFAQCGSCVEFYGLETKPGVWAFYVNGSLSSVVGSTGELDTVVADIDSNGAIDTQEQVGVDIADGRKASSVYLTLRPGANTPVRVVRLVPDPTLPGGTVYRPVWESVHQVGNGSWPDRATPWRKDIVAGI